MTTTVATSRACSSTCRWPILACDYLAGGLSGPVADTTRSQCFRKSTHCARHGRANGQLRRNEPVWRGTVPVRACVPHASVDLWLPAALQNWVTAVLIVMCAKQTWAKTNIRWTHNMFCPARTFVAAVIGFGRVGVGRRVYNFVPLQRSVIWRSHITGAFKTVQAYCFILI